MGDYAGLRVLVTGASGFLGSHATESLVSNGAHVHAFIRESSSTAHLENVKDRIAIHRGDVTDAASLLRCFQSSRPEIVFHLAGDASARRSEGGWDAVERSIGVNLLGTINVLKAASEIDCVRSIVRVGGLEEYGRSPTPFREELREQPVSAYSAAQVSAAHFCQALQPDLAFQVVTIRPALIYGPRQALRFFVPQLIESCVSGNDFDMTDGTQSRDLIYVDDVVEGLLLAGTTPDLRAAVINLSTGKEHAIADIANEIVRLTGASIQVRRGARPASHSDLRHLVGSTDHAEQALGWRARTPLGDGLARTVRWHQSQHGLSDKDVVTSKAAS
jgi:UDP-glucose 4-epimerase